MERKAKEKIRKTNKYNDTEKQKDKETINGTEKETKNEK